MKLDYPEINSVINAFESMTQYYLTAINSESHLTKMMVYNEMVFVLNTINSVSRLNKQAIKTGIAIEHMEQDDNQAALDSWKEDTIHPIYKDEVEVSRQDQLRSFFNAVNEGNKTKN